MNLLCIHCGKDAKYIFKGNSLCREHLEKELKQKEEDNKIPELIVINAPEVPE